jgi:hypothetical protein
MRARTVNEKFVENSDPIHDMKIGGIKLGELVFNYRKKCIADFKEYISELFLNRTIIGKFNHVISTKNGVISGGDGWGTYTVKVNRILFNDDVFDTSIEIIVKNKDDYDGYIVPFDTNKISIL